MGKHYFNQWEKNYRHAPQAQLDCIGHFEGYRKYNIRELAMEIGMSEKLLRIALHRLNHLKVCCEYEDGEILARLAG